MKFGREGKIITLLVIDVFFFFLEITVGYAVKSLALVADSFHMLNDVLSLIVALYAIRLATSPSTAENSYGWQRAEILGALINGVFLVALCFSIFLEAIERFVNIAEITNAKLVVVVGCAGLASNILGLFLFHGHAHSHGGGGHSHSHSVDASSDEEDSEESGAEETTPIQINITDSNANGTGDHEHDSGIAKSLPVKHSHIHAHKRRDSAAFNVGGRRERSESFSSLYGHPAQTRAAVIETAAEFGYGRPSGSAFSPREETPLLSPRLESHRPSHGIGGVLNGGSGSSASKRIRSQADDASATERYTDVPAKAKNGHGHSHECDTDAEDGHGHAHDLSEAEAGGHDHSGHSHGPASQVEGGDDHSHGGHSHGSMNMHGVFLHVLGDALGNVGVIAAGLVILLAEGDWKYYFDPAISLLITIIIFSSALPLVKSASYILMQGVPGHISLDAVRNSISRVEGVASLHELHIWQLSEKTVVASVHVLISPDHEYMVVADKIRKALHEHGVHSSTIQPEYEDRNGNGNGSGSGSGTDSTSENACLIRCPPDQCGPDACCPPIGQLIDVDGNQDTVNSNNQKGTEDASQ